MANPQTTKPVVKESLTTETTNFLLPSWFVYTIIGTSMAIGFIIGRWG